MVSKTTSWKQKIDPAVVPLLKNFIKFIDTEDEEIISQRSENTFSLLIDSGITSFKLFYENKNNTECIMQLGDMAKSFSSLEELAESIATVQDREMIRDKITPELALWSSFLLMNNICQIIEKKTLYDLYENAKNGDDKSLFALLRYDRTLFDHEWFRERIFKEYIRQNDIFFDRLGDAIKSDPPIGKHGKRKVKLFLIMFWMPIFSKLSYKEQMDLLEEIGLELKDDPLAYKKLVREEIKPLFK
jgi:hypothetical protein